MTISKVYSGIIVVITALLAGCTQSAVTMPEPKSAPFELTLRQLETGDMELTIDLNTPQPVLFFSRSDNDYRQGTYESLTEGARLERIGEFDTIIFEPGTLQAKFRLTPFTGNMLGTYNAFIPFSDGGDAVFTGAFELLRADSVEAIQALNGDLDAWDGEQFDIPMMLQTKGRVLLMGEVTEKTAKLIINGSGPYAYLGQSSPTQGNSFSGIVDTGLPSWLSESFDNELGQIFTALEARFDRKLENKASILLAFRGYEPEGFSNTGGVLPGGQMVLDMSGSMFREPNDRLKGYLQWFLTHEAAHMFQQAGHDTPYADSSDSWLSEGSANSMAYIVLGDLDTVSDTVIQGRYAQSYAACVEAIKGASMAQITARNDQTHYDCGDFIWRIAAAALPDADVFEIWDGVTDRASAKDGEDQISYNTEGFYETLTAKGAQANIVEDIKSFIEGPNADPSAQLQDLMKRVGIDATLTERGELTQIVFPQ